MKALWAELIDQLKTEKEQVIQMIQSYPPPIPACDAQFNYLLEKRYQLAHDLSYLIRLSEQNPDAISELMQFADTSPFVSQELKERLALAAAL